MEGLAGYDSDDGETASTTAQSRVELSNNIRVPVFNSAQVVPASVLSTQSMAVTTIVDNQFVEAQQLNLPLSKMTASSFNHKFESSQGIGQIMDTHVDDYVFDQEYQAHQRMRLNERQNVKNTSSSSKKAGKRKRDDDKGKKDYKTADTGDEYSDPWSISDKNEEQQKEEALLEKLKERKAKLDEAKKGKDRDIKVQEVLKAKITDDGPGANKGHIAMPPSTAGTSNDTTSNNADDGLEVSVGNEKEASAEESVQDKEGEADETINHGDLEVDTTEKEVKAFDITSTFHGKELKDYQGRSWTYPPIAARGARHITSWEEAKMQDNYLPKKCVKKYTGHNKGVQQMLFYPRTGHLLLSASLDGKCKIWDVYTDKLVKRTYSGHTKGVRGIDFSNTGLHFLSSGFDNVINAWDVETGDIMNTIKLGHKCVGYNVKYYPNDNNQFLVACSNNRIYGYDIRSNEMIQEYNYHLKGVNSVLFFDDGRRFVSTSDDKKLLCWEYGIPVPTKYISEPEMHSMPITCMHPSQGLFVGQSMDNSIVTYSCAGEKVKQNKKKSFNGHNNAGYAIGMTFSRNGHFLSSGDALGRAFCWDFKTGRMLTKFQAHDNGPCTDVVAHPHHASWMATCGWDGLIKLWE